MPESVRILGIDPGYDRCGWAVLQVSGTTFQLIGAGTLTTKRQDSHFVRLQELWSDLESIFAEFQPTEFATESLYFSRNVSTALPVSEVRGMLFSLCFHHQVTIAEYTPARIKVAVAGHGRADKLQVQKSVQRWLGLETNPKLDDTSDAIAIAYTHAVSREHL